MKIISQNIDDTQNLAKQIAQTLKGGEIIGLKGDLGAGKTAFVQGLAKALGVKEKVNSPTFILMKLYPVKLTNCPIKLLVHVDAYRLNDYDELKNIGLEEYLNRPDTAVAIEWVEKVSQISKLPHYQEIHFSFNKKTDQRIIETKKAPQ